MGVTDELSPSAPHAVNPDDTLSSLEEDFSISPAPSRIPLQTGVGRIQVKMTPYSLGFVYTRVRLHLQFLAITREK